MAGHTKYEFVDCQSGSNPIKDNSHSPINIKCEELQIKTEVNSDNINTVTVTTDDTGMVYVHNDIKVEPLRIKEECASPSDQEQENASEPSPSANHHTINTFEYNKHFQCLICLRMFRNKDRLRRHISYYISKTLSEYDSCHNGASHEINKQHDVRTHPGEKPYECNICLKRFSRNGNLVDHMRTHTGEKTHECGTCQKLFNRKSHLSQHMRTHTGEKPHECNICHKQFSQKGNLVKHIRTHTTREREKINRCGICQKIFNRKTHLTQHMRTHTGEKPYGCNICFQRFGRNGHLAVHMRTHTGDKPYKCSTCQKDFNRKSHLIRHALTHR